MESEIIKQTFKLGNSAGVLLPVDWKDKRVKIQLIDKSLTLDILEILEEKDLLKNVIGIYLAGSYARDEASPESDVDILVITDNVNKQIKVREYEIVLLSKDRLEKNFLNNLYLVSLVSEAKTIINDNYIQKYREIAPRINVKKHLDEIKSMIKINDTSIEIDEELGNKIPDGIYYSLVLRLRELYLLDCIKKNKKATNEEFIKLILKISGSIEPYKAYLRIKNDESPKEKGNVLEAKKLIMGMKERVDILEHGNKRK